MEMTFETDTDGPRRIAIDELVVAGWTARDRAALEHHIAELAEHGVPAPSQVPLYYRVSVALLTRSDAIQVLGADSSGEVEPVLVDDGEALWLGLGSDHTDRKLEAHGVAISKQACAKPVAGALWRFDDLRDRLDALELAAWVRDNDAEDWTLYQEGTLAAIRPLGELIAASPLGQGARMAPGSAMMCGTLGARGGVRPARQFRMELRDPARERMMTHSYTAHWLPVIA